MRARGRPADPPSRRSVDRRQAHDAGAGDELVRAANGPSPEWTAQRLADERRRAISICLPARNEAQTIGAIIDALAPLRERGVVDEIVVVDDSIDGTGDIARRHGADVHRQDELCPELGPVLGKGDAMWRSLTILKGDVVCFLDADSTEAGPHYACGLVGPVACRDDIEFVKGFYRRPLQMNGIHLPEGGGRVTELCARPLLNAFYPELAGIRQPLAGEIAARRDLLLQLPFATGYAVDIALLIDAWQAVGLDAIAQVDLDVRQNRHQALADLSVMAADVLSGVTARLEDAGRVGASAGDFLRPDTHGGLVETSVALRWRPAMASLSAADGRR